MRYTAAEAKPMLGWLDLRKDAKCRNAYRYFTAKVVLLGVVSDSPEVCDVLYAEREDYTVVYRTHV